MVGFQCQPLGRLICNIDAISSAGYQIVGKDSLAQFKLDFQEAQSRTTRWIPAYSAVEGQILVL